MFILFSLLKNGFGILDVLVFFSTDAIFFFAEIKKYSIYIHIFLSVRFEFIEYDSLTYLITISP